MAIGGGLRVRGEQISKSISSETKENRIVRQSGYHQGKLGRSWRIYKIISPSAM